MARWRIATVFLYLALSACLSASSSPAPLTSLSAIHQLTNQQATELLPVAFEATVTYYRRGNVDLFVQDGDVGIYVETSVNEDLTFGDRVQVTGITRASFRPEIKASQVTVLHHGLAPPAVPADFSQLIRAEFDCRRVKVLARVRSANTILDVGSPSTYLHLQMDGGPVDAEVFNSVAKDMPDLLDAEVEITGVAAGKFDSKTQMTGILLEVPSLADVKIVHPAPPKPDTAVLTPMDEVIKGYNVLDRSQRINVAGAVTYYMPGTTVVLQDGARSLWLATNYEGPLRIGEWVVGSGFPQVSNGFLTLTNTTIQPSHRFAPVEPHPADVTELARGVRAYDLVTVQGRLLTTIHGAAHDEFVLISGDHLFSAVYRYPGRDIAQTLPRLKNVAPGTNLSVTGICKSDRGDFYQGIVPFEILLRSQDDLVELASPPLLNVQHLLELVGVLLVIIFAIGLRAWITERRLRNRAAQMVNLEQMRNGILAHINRFHPLGEILVQISRLVSAALPGSRAWCVLDNGDVVGERPTETEGLRLAHIDFPSRAGRPYGALWAAFSEGQSPNPDESDILSSAAELATLAIEASRMHSDLVKRSEYDLLTGLHNRFSLHQHLDAAPSKEREGLLALIYLDLDNFKQVNDCYGHNFGDLYLREVAARMKRQIRPGDLLARLGGDEFAVVVSGARTRADVEDIAHRLERSLDPPFELEGKIIHGSVSAGIAYYPEDGLTRAALLNAADLAMYRKKNTRREISSEL
ncbi:diguanylate cyclase domain-containing protein [Occallatibacter riparius]|uniref:Diguanylate cyclase n=1 Tax=Occallatibacter riparius TaxID=1002689 RepID=A0A9J7BM40_9BACT|nr:diguanylate cyclase [Occallatibacter riparius]UWZ83561.1 diguanylate cyclase [Occallatibacter riparius]